MPTAEEQFLETFRRFNNNWNLVLSLRQFRTATDSIAPLALQEYHAGLMEAAATEPDFRRIFGDADKPTDPEVLSFIQTQITQMVLNNASTAIDAASLVFAQSILDDAAWSYLKVCATADPAAWEYMFENKQVSVKDFKTKAFEQVRADFIEDRLKQIGRESLLTKISLLFKLCSPPKDYAPMNNYQYNEDRLKTIDGQRHRIIHENAAGTPLPTLADDLEYLQKTAWFLMGLVNQKYKLKIDMRQYFNLQTATPQEVTPPES
jgi:hypothetical protein